MIAVAVTQEDGIALLLQGLSYTLGYSRIVRIGNIRHHQTYKAGLVGNETGRQSATFTIFARTSSETPF